MPNERISMSKLKQLIHLYDKGLLPRLHLRARVVGLTTKGLVPDAIH